MTALSRVLSCTRLHALSASVAACGSPVGAIGVGQGLLDGLHGVEARGVAAHGHGGTGGRRIRHEALDAHPARNPPSRAL